MKAGKNNVILVAVVAVVAVSAIAMMNPSLLHFPNRPESGNLYQEMMRFNEVLNAVSRYYVDEVDNHKLIDGAISGMLETLDPHSVLIAKEQLADVTERFEGHFFGIGIEFVMSNKWPTIVAPIADSPSDRLGLRSGDQIIKIEEKTTYNLPENEIIERLRGQQGSKVQVTIKRPALDDPFDVTIIRDKISIFSVEPAFLMDNQTGYIRIKRFSKTTSDELEQSLTKLEAQGMKSLILDLRSNPGGFLDQAVGVADKFLERGRKIVYTRGRIPQASDDFYATDDDHHPQTPLIVLLDHGSASASEIVAGACQDWDRALVVGETSFGKGLVQNQIGLKDGSAIRVTTSKYYTPSGRLIQRHYESGHVDNYLEEAYDDIDPNASADSLKNRPVYKTSSGRLVYGGGGITPDVNLKWQRYTRLFYELVMNRVFFEYANEFAARNKQLATDFASYNSSWMPSDKVLSEFRRFAEAVIAGKKLKFDQPSWDTDLPSITLYLKKEIALHLWDRDKAARVEISNDPQFAEVMRLLPQAEKLAALGEGMDGRPPLKKRGSDNRETTIRRQF
ncbi:MAG: S41 family peptidase [bacterium]